MRIRSETTHSVIDTRQLALGDKGAGCFAVWTL
jgi:hypothetical protein